MKICVLGRGVGAFEVYQPSAGIAGQTIYVLGSMLPEELDLEAVMRRMTLVISWAAFCFALAIGAAAAQDKDENAEANAQADSYWEQLLAKCGESYLYKGDKYATLHEYRDVSFAVTPRPLSEADRLNGIRWAGTFNLSAKAYRQRPKHAQEWGKWKDGGSLEFKAQNVNGKWSFFRRQYVFRWIPVSFEKPSCDLVNK